MIRFLADENLAVSVVAALRQEGWEITTVLEEGLASASDETVLRHARKQKRVILTHDKDFGNLLHYPERSHGGVVLLRLKNQSPHNVIRHLVPFLRAVKPSKIKGRLVIIQEERARFV